MPFELPGQTAAQVLQAIQDRYGYFICGSETERVKDEVVQGVAIGPRGRFEHVPGAVVAVIGPSDRKEYLAQAQEFSLACESDWPYYYKTKAE